MGRRWGAPSVVAVASVLLVLVSTNALACEPPINGLTSAATEARAASAAAGDSAVPAAKCGPGSRPETGLQGQVPAADRASGRSASGYSCNLAMTGRFRGTGASWVNQSYGHCSYMASSYTDMTSGVQVLDVSDPRHPIQTAALRSPAMLAPWESLKVNAERGLLAAVLSPLPGFGPAFFDLYDIKTDCAHPRLLNSIASTDLSVPSQLFGHEANWSPDGLTFWVSSSYGGILTAIDVAAVTHPRILYSGTVGPLAHGLSLSPDGKTLYLARSFDGLASITDGNSKGGNGVQVLDVTQVQDRELVPLVQPVSTLTWQDGAGAQHTIALRYGSHPYLLEVDELGLGAARLLDIADAERPRIVSKLKLAIQLPKAAAARADDIGDSDFFGYNAHYCAVDRLDNPTAAACGYFESGIRVFDIRNPKQPREVAYFNPPTVADTNSSGIHPGAEYCSSPPAFHGNQLWVACQEGGFMVLSFTNRSYPLSGAGFIKTSRAGSVLAGGSLIVFLSICVLGIAMLRRQPLNGRLHVALR